MGARRPIHPLLLEPSYWHRRLDAIGKDSPALLLTPRPDLCAGGREVLEFRIRAHDGERLWGLQARPTLRAGPWPARIRSVGPAELVDIDRRWIEEGGAEFVFQEPAGRRLEDRVLDVITIARAAGRAPGIDRERIRLTGETPQSEQEGRTSDELRIAEQLLRSFYPQK